MEDDLAISLLTNLVDKFDSRNDSTKVLEKSIHALGKTAKYASTILADTFIGGKAVEELEKVYGKIFKNSEDTDTAKAINNLKEQFQKAVNDMVNGQKRIAIFIDDLDRLQPVKAVELLEVLKLFLDCENCVFILAIDYDVVSKGVKQKYSVNGETLGEDKGRNFFDKIIQVPFKMPVARYKLEKYVTSMLKDLGINCQNDYEAKAYISLIKTSIGANPRSMKRLFNAFLLLTKVATIDITKNDSN